jgi:hypothetical protein
MKKKELLWIKSFIDTPEKWAQGDAVRGDRHCIITATNKVFTKPDQRARRNEVYSALLDHAGVEAAGTPDADILAWNDSTTHEKVMAAFDELIEKTSK